MAWTTTALVAEKIGIDADTPGLDAIVEAAISWCQSKRPDLTEATLQPMHQLAALLFAAHLYQIGWAPQAAEVYEDLGADAGAQDSLLSEIYRLLAPRKLMLQGIRP
jgi:hypothetical protein